MRIAEIQVYQKGLPVKDGPYTMSGQQVWSLKTTLVRLVSDSGLEGWGEVCPVGPLYWQSHAGGALAALEEMGEALIGAEVLPLSLHRAMDGALHGHNYAKSAVDIAGHDLLGKHLGVPVCDLLGGAVSNRMISYFATGIGEPDEIARLAAEKAAEGYVRLQVKAGGRAVEQDIETVRKVWEKVQAMGTRLAVDANRGMTQHDAITLSRVCADIPFVLEQPCNTIEEVAAIRPLIRHPIYLDENTVDISTILRVIGAGLVDGFGMKVQRVGGLQRMTTVRDICAARNLPHTCDDAWGGDIAAAAQAHIGATVDPRLLEGVWLSTPYIEASYDPENPVQVVEGHVHLPKGPGLGIIPEESLFGAPVASFGG
ncbi:MAG: mandelate racemase/muconate lactonizing enzyme family protein [Rhodobacteraceae bacterium]|nr:mandelate racemase/muconate lactonizing enzyme family protein [Paracoccaceae bacterium]